MLSLEIHVTYKTQFNKCQQGLPKYFEFYIFASISPRVQTQVKILVALAGTFLVSV